MSKNIFIGGITGVGKTTIAEMLNNKIKDVEIINVGEIACKNAAELFAAVSIELLSEVQLDYCQEVTAIEIANIINSKTACCNMIVGHFVLAGEHRDTYRMPVEFFKKLNIETILLISAFESTIKERLQKTGQKTRPQIVLNSMEYYLMLEKEHAYFISDHIHSEIIEIKNDDISLNQLMGLIRQCSAMTQ